VPWPTATVEIIKDEVFVSLLLAYVNAIVIVQKLSVLKKLIFVKFDLTDVEGNMIVTLSIAHLINSCVAF